MRGRGRGRVCVWERERERDRERASERASERERESLCARVYLCESLICVLCMRECVCLREFVLFVHMHEFVFVCLNDIFEGQC